MLFLSARYDINLVDETRRDNGSDAVARGERWEAFALENGGLFDMIEGQRRDAFEAFADLRPDDIAEKTYLAAQDRCWRQVRARIEGVIATGKMKRDAEAADAAVVSLRKSA